ncbi:MAG: site-specific integrase [Byssovorax sp.]
MTTVPTVTDSAGDPVVVYLARLHGEKSWRTMRAALATVAAELGAADAHALPWSALRYPHGAELAALLGACDRATPSGVRDAALLGIAYGAGLRRAELVALTLAALDLTTGAIRLIGKGNKERTTYAPAWAVLLVRSWLDVRGHHEGPLFVRIDKAGACDLDGPALSDEAVRFLFARLAGVASFTPHDTRRSCISDLLDAGADISTVQRLAGHASPTVTQRYDRRGERSKRQAAALLRDLSAAL